MKWKTGKPCAEFLPEKTFLILKDNLESLTIKRPKQWTKSKSAAETGTWPPKVKKLCPYTDDDRPKTANLEKPSVLDPTLVNKLDMSLLRKEVLSDSMARIQLGMQKESGGMASSNRRGVQQTIGDKRSATLNVVESGASHTRYKRRSFDHLSIDHHITNRDTSLEFVVMRKQSSPNPSMNLNERFVKKRSLDLKKLDDNNNNKDTTSTTTIITSRPIPALSTVRMTKSSRPVIPSEIEVFTNSITELAPEPCKTCGRSDQPERFHSHPKGIAPMRISSKDNNVYKGKDAEKKIVQKPVALNFRSERNKVKDDKTDVTAEKMNAMSVRGRPSSVKRGPRTVTCYICAREFGTASFPIHEPKCLQKWERENDALPPSQRRSAPQRPILSVNDQEWNTVAWEQSQMQLVPCSKCGRTFLPNRLTIHEKTCKALPKPNSSPSEIPDKVKCGSSHGSTSEIFCKTCGQTFSTRAIKIHEQKCLQKREIEVGILSNGPTNRASLSSTSPIRDSSNKRTTTCYLCGRNFGSASIDIHEPQCLKKWQIENAKLPPNQRRTEPQKPEVIYRETPSTEDNTIDWPATSEARWQSHLGQLVPCKNCKRTFNPDRVSIHERNCRGSR